MKTSDLRIDKDVKGWDAQEYIELLPIRESIRELRTRAAAEGRGLPTRKEIDDLTSLVNTFFPGCMRVQWSLCISPKRGSDAVSQTQILWRFLLEKEHGTVFGKDPFSVFDNLYIHLQMRWRRDQQKRKAGL